MVVSIAAAQGGIEAIILFDSTRTNPERCFVDLPTKFRALPENLTFLTGLKVKKLPIIAYAQNFTQGDKRKFEIGGAKHISTEWDDPVAAALEITSDIQTAIRDFKKILLDDFSGHGFAVRSEAGRLRIDLALVRKGKAETENFYWGAVPKSHVLFLGIDPSQLSSQLAKYSHLINKKGVTELEMQAFFEKHPDFLLQGEFDRCWPRFFLPWEKPKTKFFCDFVLRPIVMPSRSRRWKLLELKRPNDRLVSGRREHPRFSSTLSQAISQLRDYSRRLQEHPEQVRSKLGQAIQNPRLAVLLGFARNEDPDKVDLLSQREPDVDIITYDEIAEHQARRLESLFDLSFKT